MLLGTLLQKQVPAPAAIACTVLVGGFCGAITGTVIVRWSIPPFIATLGMMSAARGGALMMTEGRSISGFSSAFVWLGTGSVLGLPIPAAVMLLLVALAGVTAAHTYWGLCVYAIGGNGRAAWLSGIRIRAYTASVYILSGAAS